MSILAANKTICRQSAKHEDAVVALAFSPDGTFIVSGTPSGDLRVWDAAYGHCRCLLMKPCIHDLGISCLQFAPISASKFLFISCTILPIQYLLNFLFCARKIL